MINNLTVQPGWLDKYESETGKVEGVDFGWDSEGMWFTGNATGGTGGNGDGNGGYPVRTNFSFSTNDVCEVIYTIDYNDFCADHGVCIFNVGAEPEWNWGSNGTRIAAQDDCPVPFIYGQENEVFGLRGEGGEFIPIQGGEEPELGDYTFHFTYDPSAGTVNLKVYVGDDTNVAPIDDLTINETLPEGDYRVGFSADQDEFGIKAYFKGVEIRKNGVVVTTSTHTYEFSNESPLTTPNYRYGGNGNLDTTVYANESGVRVSRQRTGYFEIVTGASRKVVEVYDGETVDDAPEVPTVQANPTGNANVTDSGSTV